MKATIVKVSYLGLWLALAGAVVYFAMAQGYSLWLAAVLVYVLFVLVNGTLSYRFRARELRQEGRVPPPFLTYLFFPKPLKLGGDVAVPRPLRLLLGIVVFLGGVFFVATGVLILVNLDLSTVVHRTGAVTMLVAFAVLGLAISYVGWRVLVVKDGDRLFGSSTAHGVDAPKRGRV
jgi:hypothetical protein